MDLSLLAVFTAGIATFATPCVLPVIPLYLATLAGGDIRSMSLARRGVLLGRAALFSLGFVAVFVLLGLAASSLGAVLSAHKALISGLGAVLVALFALKFLGVVQIPLLDRVARVDDSRVAGRVSAGSAVLLGALFAAGWSPCVGPVLGSVLTFTASHTSSAWEGAAWLGLYGLGFALPLLGIAAFAEAGIKLLGRVSRYLPVFERAVGAALLVVSGAMLFDATATSGSPGLSSPPALAAATPEAKVEFAARLPRMVELYTPSCPICQRMKPIVELVGSACDNKGVRVETIDVSAPQNKRLVVEHRVVGVPTFLFFDEQGQEVARLVGEQSEATLFQALSALRGEECPGLALITQKPKVGVQAFPAPQEEVVTCRSTNTSANSVENSSSSFGEPRTQSRSLAPSAAEPRESCSADLL